MNDSTTSRVFEPWSLRTLHLRNRIAMAPMTRRMAAEDGIPTPAIVEYYRRRAAAEVGLIISEGTSIDGVHAYDTLTVPRFETPSICSGVCSFGRFGGSDCSAISARVQPD